LSVCGKAIISYIWHDYCITSNFLMSAIFLPY